MSNRLMGAAVSGSMLLALNGSMVPTLERIDQSPLDTAVAPVSTAEKTAYQQDFMRLRNHWIKRYKTAAAIKLVIITGVATGNCSYDPGNPVYVKANDPGGIVFCQTNNEIMVTEAGINLLDEISEEADVPAASARRIALGHEIGHGVQRLLSIQPPDGYYTIRYEQQADCLAGEANHEIDPLDPDVANQFYKTINPYEEPIHGSAQGRINEYKSGVAGMGCK